MQLTQSAENNLWPSLAAHFEPTWEPASDIYQVSPKFTLKWIRVSPLLVLNCRFWWREPAVQRRSAGALHPPVEPQCPVWMKSDGKITGDLRRASKGAHQLNAGGSVTQKKTSMLFKNVYSSSNYFQYTSPSPISAVTMVTSSCTGGTDSPGEPVPPVQLLAKLAVLTAAVLGVEVLVDGVQRVLLLAAMLPGSQNVPDTLVQEGVLALPHGEEAGLVLLAHKFQLRPNTQFNLIKAAVRLCTDTCRTGLVLHPQGFVFVFSCVCACACACAHTSVWTICWRCRRMSNTQL